MKVHHIGIETADMAAVKRFLQKKGFVFESILELGGETLVFMKGCVLKDCCYRLNNRNIQCSQFF